METVMECKDARALLPAYVDRELGAGDADALDGHLRGCADCRSRQAALQSVRAVVSAHATRFRAPEELADRIGDSLSAAAPRSGQVRSPFWQGAGIGAAATATLAMVLGIGLLLTQPSHDDLLVDEAVANHVRSVQGDHVVDVTSSDQHTVKPWFTGKLDYAAPVLDLTSAGFPLVGGRLDYFDNRPVAALVYRHRLHTINVFVQPAKAGAMPATARAFNRQGFAIERWTKDGMEFWAVSDADAATLSQLRALFVAPGNAR
jgi:anti-sigma factor RsiW